MSGDDAVVHTYRTVLEWSGSTAGGYDRYDRAHQVRADPVERSLRISADPAFRGDPGRLNPEQLVVMAASSCQLHSFLAVAARARLDVVGYDDVADAAMPEDDRPVRLTRIHLHPTITIVENGDSDPTDERLAHLCEVAHRECFIANSLRTEVAVTPTFVRRQR